MPEFGVCRESMPSDLVSEFSRPSPLALDHQRLEQFSNLSTLLRDYLRLVEIQQRQENNNNDQRVRGGAQSV